MAMDSSDVVNELAGAQVEFVARYYRDPASRWPPLSPGEAQRLSSLGLKIVAVYEYHKPRPEHFTYEGGYNDALTAYSEAKAVGQPAGSAIYFAADFHARYYEVASVVDYFRGVHAALAAAGGGRENYAVGVYGSAPVCNAVKQSGLARYSWLSDSITWDDGIVHDNWDIMQGSALPQLSFNNDSDQVRDDYGGFDVGPAAPAASSTVMAAAAPAAAPAPAPASAPAPVPSAAPAPVPEVASLPSSQPAFPPHAAFPPQAAYPPVLAFPPQAAIPQQGGFTDQGGALPASDVTPVFGQTATTNSE